MTRYLGKCSCGSVLDRPFVDAEQDRIHRWKQRHIEADGKPGPDGTPQSHLLETDKTYETGGGEAPAS